MTSPPDSIIKNSRFTIPLLLGIIVLTVVVLRIRLLDVPLERDEGEYAYMGQLILDGVPPYAEAYNMKFPGIYFLYAAVLAVFGQTHTSIHIGLLLFNLTSVILLYFLGRSIINKWVGVTAAASFAILSMSYHTQGLWANAEHFALPFALAAFLMLRYAMKKDSVASLMLSGMLFGLATVVKQHGAFFGLLGFAYFLISSFQNRTDSRKRTVSRLLIFVAGGVLPILGMLVYLLQAGVFERFYFWAFVYTREYGSQITLSRAPELFLTNFLPILKSSLLIWLVAVIGLVSSTFVGAFRHERTFILSITVAGFLSICTGFFFRPHYFVLLLPAVSLLFGIGVHALTLFFARASRPWLRVGPPLATAVVALVSCLGSHFDVLFQFSPVQATRATYGGNPFPEALAAASFVKERTIQDDKIAVLGNEPEILFYTQRRSATGYIYLYPLMEENFYAASMQKEMIREIETVAPKMLLEVRALPEWYKISDAEERLRKWFSEYTAAHYHLIARYEFTPGANTPALVTDTAALQEHSRQIYWIAIYERSQSGATSSD